MNNKTLTREYFYNEQLRSYIVQFMAVFAGMRVSVGKNETKNERLISTPIAYGSKDRVVADIKGENTQNKMLRLPMFSAYMSNLVLAPERRHGTGVTRRNTFMPRGGLFPDDIHVVEQRMPNPYMVTMDLYIWASNQQQHMQLLEQILSVFDPVLQIQTNEELFDWRRITSVELVGIGLEENFPIGIDNRLISTRLSFEMPVYIGVPADVHQRFVKDIYVRVGVVSQMATSSQDVVEELDAQGLDYDLIFTLDDIEGVE
jgi:hypothetical protein